MLRAILFDFNGVLVDDEPIHLELFRQVLTEEGIELDEAEYRRHALGRDDRSAFAATLAAAGTPPVLPQLMRLVARKATYYRRRIRSIGYPFAAGALELVEAAQGAGLMLGVVTGALREEVEGALFQASLIHRFKVVITAEDVAEGKPDPRGYREALAALNSRPPLPERLVHPHQVLAIEDSPAGLTAAAAAGLVTLGIAGTYPESELTEAEWVAPSLAALSLAQLQTRFAEVSSR